MIYICMIIDLIGLAWLGTYRCISNTCSVWLNRVERDSETKEEHDEDCLRGF